jgi:hypothetical protein
LLGKGTASPIPTGGAISGWLYFVFRDTKYEDAYQNGSVVSLTFEDLRGNRFSVTQTIDTTHSLDIELPP